MSSIWDWVSQRYWDSADDSEQREMVTLFYDGMDKKDDDPDAAISMMRQSRHIAERFGDEWWVQLMNHWEIQVRMYFKQDMQGVIDLAAKSAVEVRKPAFTNFPQRACLYEDLISSYAAVDPLGNEKLIEDALTYMESQVSPQVECYQCLRELRASFAKDQGDYDTAHALTMEYLEVSDGTEHHVGIAHISLAELAYRRRDWNAMLQHADRAEIAANRSESTERLIKALAWKAVALVGLARLEEAWIAYRAAVGKAKTYGATLDEGYYRATALFFEERGYIEDALSIYERHSEILDGRGFTHTEVECWLTIVRIRKQLDLDMTEAIEKVKTLCERIKEPSRFLERLSLFEDGKS